MSDIKAEDLDRKQEVAGLLPVLAQLDQTATELEQKTANGEEVTESDVSGYQLQAAHARHLVDAAGADKAEVVEAEQEHHGDGEKGFAARGLDHATHPRAFEPTTAPADSKTTADGDRDRAPAPDPDDDFDVDL